MERNFPPVQTGPGTHPASCTVGTGVFPGGKVRPGRAVDHSPPLVPRSLKSRAIPLPTFWATTGPLTGTIYLLPLFLCTSSGLWGMEIRRLALFTLALDASELSASRLRRCIFKDPLHKKPLNEMLYLFSQTASFKTVCVMLLTFWRRNYFFF